MHQVSCPNCGATITFRAGETVYAVCSFCHTAMVRNDISVESIGKIAVLQDAWSPLQIGTEGDFDGGHFFIVGRVKYGWEDGTWTEWYLSYNDGRSGWISEAQGFYALSFKTDLPPALPTPVSVRVGDVLAINGTEMVATDIKRTQVLGSEGELPFKASIGQQGISIDFVASASARHRRDDSHTPGGFASLESIDGHTSLYCGRYAEFDTLHFVNLRQIDGW